MTVTFRSFEEFWPYYLGEHRDPRNRALHYVGTSLAVGTVATAVVTLNPAWLLCTPIVGYGPAWFGHFMVEGNRPATFRHPLWSLRGDFRMLKRAVQGKLGAELERLVEVRQVVQPKSTEDAGHGLHASPTASPG